MPIHSVSKSLLFDSLIMENRFKSENINPSTSSTTGAASNTIDGVNSFSSSEFTYLPILSNGSYYTLGKTKYEIDNMCALDSFLQIFLAIYVDSPKCKAFMDSSFDNFTSIIIAMLRSNGKKLFDAKVLRGEFLRTSFSKYCDTTDRRKIFIKDSEDIVHLDCTTDIDTMFDLIVKESKYYSIKQWSVCKLCKLVHSKCELKTVPVDNGANIEIFVPFIKKHEEPSMQDNCKKCNSSLMIVRQPTRILQIDCEGFNLTGSPKDAENDEIEFNRIPQHFQYAHRNFELKAIIEVMRIQLGNMGHSVPHIKRNDGRWESFDGLKNEVGKSPEAFIVAQLIYLMREDEIEDDTYNTKYENIDIGVKKALKERNVNVMHGNCFIHIQATCIYNL